MGCGRTRAAMLVVLTCGVTGLLTGCAGPSITAHGGGRGGNRLAPLSAAIGATNTTRAALIADLATDDAAVRAADSADQTALAGDREAAEGLVPAAASAVGMAAAQTARARAEVTAYSNALTQLGAAGPAAPITAAQRQAIAAVVTAGMTEAGALRGAVAVYTSALPTYVALVADQRLWLSHANIGFFTTVVQAGDAYQVARNDQIAPLGRAREAIAAANAPRNAASGPMDAALTAARNALASLS